MRHIFILNPAAGKHSPAQALIPEIEAVCREAGCEYEIVQTEAPGDATRIAKQYAAAGKVRLYACGGDGTLLEVLQGITLGSETELAHIPCGSGNDFVRMLGGAAPYLVLRDMVRAKAVPMDGILCETADRVSYALNVAATGMDAAVGYNMVRFKRLPGVSGPMAYNLSLVKVFLGKLGCRLTVELETENGVVRTSGEYLFALCANGQYYGGGYRGAPNAQPNDGLLDFVLVEKMSRLRMLKLLPLYKKGLHGGRRGIHMWRGKSMTLQIDRPAPATLDGECFVTDRWRVSVQPNAYNLVVPESVASSLKEPQPV